MPYQRKYIGSITVITELSTHYEWRTMTAILCCVNHVHVLLVCSGFHRKCLIHTIVFKTCFPLSTIQNKPSPLHIYRIVHLTTPTLNYIIVSGSLLMYLSVFIGLLPAKQRRLFRAQCLVSFSYINWHCFVHGA